MNLSDPFMKAIFDKGEKEENSISMWRKQGGRQTWTALQFKLRSALFMGD